MNSERYFNFTDYFSKDIHAILTKNHPENLQKNVQELSLDINLNSDFLVIPDQVHSDNISIVQDNLKPFSTDGVITQDPNLILTLKVADCAPIYFEDSSNNLRGLIHSGWRGTQSKIIVKAIEKSQALGSQLENFIFFIGPCISQNNYEVSSEVAKKFAQENIMYKGKQQFVDLKGQIISDILSTGVSSEQICFSKICTYASNECYSYRRSGKLSNRMYAFFWKQD